MTLKLMLSALVLAFATGATSTNHLCEGFVPQNDLKIPVGKTFYGMKNNGGLTEAQFNSVVDRTEALYSAEFTAKGATLKVNRLWSDATVNASAQQMGNSWVVNMYGGLARHADTTVEGFALVICHEVGHHIGGAPKVESFLGMNAWATNEGGSDYFATLKCLRRFFENDDNAAIVATRTIDPAIAAACDKQFASASEQALCRRISLSGESVAYLFKSLRKETVTPTFSTPDTSEVSKTNHDHPATQCRMDTYFAGMLCTAPLSVATDEKDFKVGSCVQGVETVGFRPRCWFQPAAPTQDSSCPLGNDAICAAACQMAPTLPFCGAESVHN